MEHQSIYRSNPSEPAPERSRSYNRDHSRITSQSNSPRYDRYHDDEEFSSSVRSKNYHDDEDIIKSSRSKRHFDDERFTSSGYYSSDRASYEKQRRARNEGPNVRKKNSGTFEEINHAKDKYIPKNKPIIKDSRSDGRKKRRIISYVYILIAAAVLVVSVPLNKTLFDKIIESGKDVEVIPDAVLNLIPLNIL